ncbi:hypothetical protein [Flavihumibacter profundi]|uniref:hypothetical protein n=1 Tax=Flavihumibacter profundi TaxID=2716883 RepID=UPI001CC7FDEC|nr:hypothetical protein [Flavihumibacter profundi]MBZ5857774.1 hypothetical protein [Flavihumibacter profundi]
MRILNKITTLLTSEGLNKFIHDFRNPQISSHFIENVTYDAKNDYRIYEYDEDDSRFNPFTDGRDIVTLQKALQTVLYNLEKNLQSEIQIALPIIIEDALYKEEFSNYISIDFRKIFLSISEQPESDELKLFLVDYSRRLQSLIISLKQTIQKQGVNTVQKKGTKKSQIHQYQLVYQGPEASLSQIYNELNLESGDFINKDLTTESSFVRILTSQPNLIKTELIQFGCETRQAAYILSKLFPNVQNLWATIAKSRRFISKNGKPFTAVNLSKSYNGTIEVKGKKEIDTFFSKILKR